MSAARWWEVRTGYPNDDQRSDAHLLGRYFGFVDDIALRLADKQCGFWCEGALYFSPCSDPKLPKRDVKTRVNVVIRGIDWKGRDDLLEKMRAEFADRPVIVHDCNLYGTVTIERTKG